MIPDDEVPLKSESDPSRWKRSSTRDTALAAHFVRHAALAALVQECLDGVVGDCTEWNDRARKLLAESGQSTPSAIESPLRSLLEKWIGDGHLQTFEDRERFRKEAREVLATRPERVTISEDAPISREAWESLKDFVSQQKPIPPAFQKVINDNFWDLLLKDEAHVAEVGAPKLWRVFCPKCKYEWSVDYRHPGSELCADCKPDSSSGPKAEERRTMGPCSCQDSGKCEYIDGGPACMQEPTQ